MVYKYKIRPLYPNKYNIQQKTTHPIFKLKYNTNIQNKRPRKYHRTTHGKSDQEAKRSMWKLYTIHKGCIQWREMISSSPYAFIYMCELGPAV